LRNTTSLELETDADRFLSNYCLTHNWDVETAIGQIVQRYAALLEDRHGLSEEEFHFVLDLMTPGALEDQEIPVGNDRRSVRRVALNALLENAEDGFYPHGFGLTEEDFKTLTQKVIGMDRAAEIALTEAVEIFWAPKT
jgi:hypothetical protein